jgi:hypothetical protein
MSTNSGVLEIQITPGILNLRGKLVSGGLARIARNQNATALGPHVYFRDSEGNLFELMDGRIG